MVRGITCARDADSDDPDATSTALPEMLGHYTGRQEKGRVMIPAFSIGAVAIRRAS